MAIQLSLKQIECFLVVCEELNFRKAADRLNMTQSPLTRQIQSLEHSLNARLFERTNKSVAITDDGETFRRYAVTVVNAVDEALELIKYSRGDSRLAGLAASSALRDPRMNGLLDGRQAAGAEKRKIRPPVDLRRDVSSRTSAMRDVGTDREPDRDPELALRS